MVAVINGDVVIAYGNYTQEDYPDSLLVEITQEQYDLIATFIEPKYNGVKFYDQNFVDVQYEGEKYYVLQRLDAGAMLYAEVLGKLRVLYKVGLITQQEYDLRISAFIPVRSEILKGDIDLGKETFLLIDSEIYGEEMYNHIVERFDFYIGEYYFKYPWEYTSRVFSKTT